jgi:hypothetical protein
MALNTGKTQLREALAANGVTLAQVGSACGVSRGAVSQWFIDGPNGRPVPERHLATIRELLASHPQERQVKPPTPARRRSPPPVRPRRSPPQPRSPIHYPEHWAPPPAMPTPTQGHVRPATGPQHSDFVAEHNYASQHGASRGTGVGERLEFFPPERNRKGQ